MTDKYDLDDVETSSLMDNVNQYVARLRQLQFEMIEAEEAYRQAKLAFDNFSRKTVPDIFKMNGLDAIMTENGQKVAVVTKTTCSLKKGDGKKSAIEWLRQHNGEALIKEKCIVPIEELSKLESNGIIFERDTDVNTNSVKAFLLDALGQKGSPATIEKEDIPEGISFYQWDEMEITEVN